MPGHKNLLGDSWDIPVFFLVAGFFLKKERLHHARAFILFKFKGIYLKLLYFYVGILCLHNAFLDLGLYKYGVEYGGKYMEQLTISNFLIKLSGVVLFMGREPYASPLWFVYVLFMAFIVMSLMRKLLWKVFRADEYRCDVAMLIISFILAVISFALTNHFALTIPRLSIVFPAMWLIIVGYVLKNKLSLTFTNAIAAIASLIVLSIVALCSNHVAMMTNSFRGVVHLTVCGVSALYLFAYISKKLERAMLGRFLAYLGNNSFYIMALHLLFINIAAAVANTLLGSHYPIYQLGCSAHCFCEFLSFTAIGLITPALFMSCFFFVKHNCIALWKKH